MNTPAAAPANPELIASANKVNKMQGELKYLQRTAAIAVALAPAFRDKFDFSDPKQFTDLADIAWKAAQAMVVKEKSVLEPFEKEITDVIDAHNVMVLADHEKNKVAALPLNHKQRRALTPPPPPAGSSEGGTQ